MVDEHTVAKSLSFHGLWQYITEETHDRLKKIFDTDKEMTTELLLEISAGAGAVLGDSFEELVVELWSDVVGLQHCLACRVRRLADLF